MVHQPVPGFRISSRHPCVGASAKRPAIVGFVPNSPTERPGVHAHLGTGSRGNIEAATIHVSTDYTVLAEPEEVPGRLYESEPNPSDSHRQTCIIKVRNTVWYPDCGSVTSTLASDPAPS